MNRFKTALLFLSFFSIIFQSTAFAQLDLLEEARRLDIKCLSEVEADGDSISIRKRTFGAALSLYEKIYDKLQHSKRGRNRYVFGNDPSEEDFFVAHAKAFFPKGALRSLYPKADLNFLDVFFVTEIDTAESKLTIINQQEGTSFRIGVGDFERAFVWYSALLDAGRVYIPIYGFLSIPSDAKELPIFYDGYGKDNKEWVKFSDYLRHFDFYKILDYQNGRYLLALDRDIFGYVGQKKKYGILGWIEEKYIILWRSRLYYHPRGEVAYFESPGVRSHMSDEINRFYLHQNLQVSKELFSTFSEPINDLRDYYKNFGFPELYPPYTRDDSYAKIYVLGAFPYRLHKMILDYVKSALNVFYLIDTTSSMVPFKDFIISFKNGAKKLSVRGFGINESSIFGYFDSQDSDDNDIAEIEFSMIDFVEDIEFGKESRDSNYREPLMRAFIKVLRNIATRREEKSIGPLEYVLLFIMTDAGPNDKNPEIQSRIAQLITRVDPFVFFLIPKESGAKVYLGMTDTPEGAYKELTNTIGELRGFDKKNYRKPMDFPAHFLESSESRRRKFEDTSTNILEEIENVLNELFNRIAKDGKIKNIKAPFLNFIPKGILGLMEEWSISNFQVIGHEEIFIDNVKNQAVWEERVAIPLRIIDTYVKAREESDITLFDLKKMCIVNSLLSVYTIKECRETYEILKEILKIETSDRLESAFYRSVTGRFAHPKTTWNHSLTRDQLDKYLKERVFYLNLVEKRDKSRYIFLNLSEIFKEGE